MAKGPAEENGGSDLGSEKQEIGKNEPRPGSNRQGWRLRNCKLRVMCRRCQVKSRRWRANDLRYKMHCWRCLTKNKAWGEMSQRITVNN